jgi:hypothetical protein
VGNGVKLRGGFIRIGGELIGGGGGSISSNGSVLLTFSSDEMCEDDV